MIHLVQAFHRKFDLPTGEEDHLSKDTSLQKFRANFLVEEVEELLEAFEENNRTKAFDALLDLVYVAHGTALLLGVEPDQWHAGMEIVHRCNMRKVKVASASESKRGHASDVRKPEGWTGPEDKLKEILAWPKRKD